MIYVLFFLSGISGLIYQVVWVRVFGNVFGNTIYSASTVVAIFMLGLGVGSYVAGAWADRRYAEKPDSLLRAYAAVELLIAALGLGIALLLPHLGAVSAQLSSYMQDEQGWYVLTTGTYVARAAIAALLLTPITLLMGGTLTLLIRHTVRSNVAIGGWTIALLYAANTFGAALGCLLTDFTFVRAYGLQNTQLIAIALNAIAGAGAMALAYAGSAREPRARSAKPPKAQSLHEPRAESLEPSEASTALAVFLSGFAALGVEILWFRHFTILLGQFRAVFSLLLAVILVGIGVGALLAGSVSRRTARPAIWFAGVQALFIVFTLAGLWLADATAIDAALEAAGAAALGSPGGLAELWFNARPILMEVGIPALLMGFSFPLANAIVQRAEAAVGRRAGLLYLANTVGAVLGSLVTGFLLLPALGLQASTTVLMVVVVLSIGTVLAGARTGAMAGVPAAPAVAVMVLAVAAIAGWLALPSNYVISRALPRPASNEQVLTLDEGVTEVIAVTELGGRGRTLMTNGHAMSSTRALSQRYMRALAHIPLLLIDDPRDALVIGFGVGNTTQAATLHPTMRRIDLADLSRDVLQHARYFAESNHDVLRDSRVRVHINDGRQHLQMQPAGAYDLVTLEPPPIGYAGVAALYSREFYELAKSRLKQGGYLSQWLPAYQVPTETTLAMVRAFLDVFPEAVLLSGAEADLLLLGANGAPAQVDPDRLAARLAQAPAVREDLERIDLGSVTEIVGSFVGSAETMAAATAGIMPVTDDRPIQEYGVQSLLNFGEAVPSSIVDLDRIASWCPRCFEDGRPVPAVAGLDLYLALLRGAYQASAAEILKTRQADGGEGRELAGSAYLGAIVPDSAQVHNVLGVSLAAAGQLDAAIEEFREALRHDPDSAAAHWHLGAALASRGDFAPAVEHLQRSVSLDPTNQDARSDLAAVQAAAGAGRPLN